MIELLRPIVKIMLSPLVHIPIMLLFSLLLFRINAKKAGVTLLIITVAWYWAASTSFLSTKLAGSLESQYPSTDAEQLINYQPQVIVVLACFYFDDDLLPFISRWPECSVQRLMHAYILHKETGIPIVVTGGNVESNGNTINLAEQSAYFFNTLGVKSTDIVIIGEGNNTNTRQEAQAIKKASFDKVALVTSAIHMPRAVNEFERLGIDVLASPAGYLIKTTKPVFGWPNATSLSRIERVIYEYLGLMYQKLNSGSAANDIIVESN